MCETCASAESGHLIVRAREAADEVIERLLRIPVCKAMDLSTPKGFDQAVAGLASKLRGASAASDRGAVKAAIEVLDVDWHVTTAAQRRSLVAQAMEAAGRHTSKVVQRVVAPFGEAADEVVGATRDNARSAQRLGIAG